MMKELTAMQRLKGKIQNMVNNGGDADLLSVLGIIDGELMEVERKQIVMAHKELSKLEEPICTEQAIMYFNRKYKGE